MTPAEAGFDGAKGIRMNLPGVKDGGRFYLKRGKTTPFDYPSKDFREQLLWFYPDDAPARLLWCNPEDQWFELTFTPIAKNTSLIPPMTEQRTQITPPPELVQQWANACPYELDTAQWVYEQFIAASAAQWGADQELEACCEWLVNEGWFKYEHEAIEDLRVARRPKPPSPKLQALKAISHLLDGAGRSADNANAAATIRRALEALPND
jgi:hypothetical protein